MKRLFTIGYEGAQLSDFVETLRDAKIDVLLDVREIPISRRRGFSKTALRQTVEGAGIAYRHERRLGSPKALRHKLRVDGDYQRFFSAFERYLDAHWDLVEAIAQELKGNVALMCYEKDHVNCHRRSVANALGDLLGKSTVHLGVIDHARKAQKGPRTHPRQSVSTA